MPEKLVISYSTGEYDSYSAYTVCLIYESAEAFYVHLEAAVKNYIQELTKYLTSPKRIILEPPEKFFKIGDKLFYLEDFINRHKVKNITEKSFDICMPDIERLDEWFDNKLQENLY